MVNIVGSRSTFRVSSVVSRSVFTIVISIQTRSPTLSSKHHARTVWHARWRHCHSHTTVCDMAVTVAPPSVSTMKDFYALIIQAHMVALHCIINHNCYQLPANPCRWSTSREINILWVIFLLGLALNYWHHGITTCSKTLKKQELWCRLADWIWLADLWKRWVFVTVLHYVTHAIFYYIHTYIHIHFLN